MRSVTTLFASASPWMVGAVALLIPSVLETPLSDAVTRSRADGVVAVVSMVMVRAADAAPVLPATSTASAVRLCRPADSEADAAIVHSPPPSAVTVPRLMAPS